MAGGGNWAPRRPGRGPTQGGRGFESSSTPPIARRRGTGRPGTQRLIPGGRALHRSTSGDRGVRWRRGIGIEAREEVGDESMRTGLHDASGTDALDLLDRPFHRARDVVGVPGRLHPVVEGEGERGRERRLADHDGSIRDIQCDNLDDALLVGEHARIGDAGNGPAPRIGRVPGVGRNRPGRGDVGIVERGFPRAGK